MQLTLKQSGDNTRLLFARGSDRDYMVRSEKRPGPKRGADHEPPRRRPRPPRRTNIPYALLTFLMLAVLYPIGLVLLWLRMIPWRWTTKMGVTLIFAVVFVFAVSFALTVPVQNETLQAWQSKGRDALTNAGTRMTENWARLDITSERVLTDAQDIAGYSIQIAQNSITKGIPLLINSTSGITKGAKDMVYSAGRVVKRGTRDLMYQLNLIPEPSAQTDPSATPDTTASPAPSVTPDASPASSPAPSAEGLVAWHVEGDGIYHLDEHCERIGGNAVAMTILDAVSDGLMPCEVCARVDEQEPDGTADPAAPAIGKIEQPKSLDVGQGSNPTDEPTNEPADQPADNLTDEPGEPDSHAQMPQTEPELGNTEAVEQTLKPAPAPTLPAMTVQPSPSPDPRQATPSPAPTPTPVPTPEPTPIALPDIKPVGEVAVYYHSSSTYYHAQDVCTNMSKAPAHTFAEAIAAGKKRCSRCNPPAPELLSEENVVWVASELFHITDECEAISGTVTLMPMTQAMLEEGYDGCDVCGADLFVLAAKQAAPDQTPIPAPE